LQRWAVGRDRFDAVAALLLALACPLIKPSGALWALTLLPGAVVVLMPRRGLKIVGMGFGVAALVVLALAQIDTTIAGYRLHLDYEPQWTAQIAAYLLSGNWHLLWYGAIGIAVIGARTLVRPPLAALAVVVASAHRSCVQRRARGARRFHDLRSRDAASGTVARLPHAPALARADRARSGPDCVACRRCLICPR
jgi:hypothetical protein